MDWRWSQDSEDQLSDGSGEPLNQSGFLLRRARLQVADQLEVIDYALQVDLSTVDGPRVGVRRAEAGISWPFRVKPPTAAPGTTGTPSLPPGPTADVAASPPPAPPPVEGPSPFQVRFAAGILRAPFGHDVFLLSHAARLFSEPSLTAQAFFPGDFDVGAQLDLRYGAWSLVLAVQNGEPVGTRSFPGQDPNLAKDFFGRVATGGELGGRVRVEGGLSAMSGTGFHPGTPATKDTTVWRDYNEDGIVQLNELTAIPGASATPSQNFDRWGLGGDVRLVAGLPVLGELTVFAEAAVATNLDRALRPADPVSLGRAQRTVAAYAGFTQELGKHALVGFRYDFYEPSLDQTRFAGGVLVRSVERFQSFSVAAAALLGRTGPVGAARLMGEYSHRRDPLGRDSAGRPTDLANDTVTVRLQVEF